MKKERVTIAFLNQKGGTGKTTTCTNIGWAFKLKGYTPIIVDTDPQGSARDWHAASGGMVIDTVGFDRDTLESDIKTINDKYDIILIDGSPRISKSCAMAIKSADIVIIPVQPSPYDIWACKELLDAIKARLEMTGDRPKVAFLGVRVIKNSNLSKEFDEALSEYGVPVLNSMIKQRVVYAETVASGETVFHRKDAPEARHEVYSAMGEILEMINAKS